METSGPNSYVNVPDLKQIVVINRNTGNISHWPVAFDNNFPMALDEGGHRLFVATRAPARLAVFDTISGHMVTALPCVQNSDDLYFDAARKRIYVAGGEGYVNVFQQKDGELYNPAARGFLRRWTPHGWVLRQGKEGVRGLLLGRPCTRRCRSGGLGLHRTGLAGWRKPWTRLPRHGPGVSKPNTR